MEDYLVAILDGSSSGSAMRGGDLAVMLALTHGSVTSMVARLRAAGWIAHRHHRGIALTPEGRTLAEHTIRRRRAVEGWLRRLGLEEATVQRHAHVIEHGLSHSACLALENWLGQHVGAAKNGT